MKGIGGSEGVHYSEDNGLRLCETRETRVCVVALGFGGVQGVAGRVLVDQQRCGSLVAWRVTPDLINEREDDDASDESSVSGGHVSSNPMKSRIEAWHGGEKEMKGRGKEEVWVKNDVGE
jgi:hypothetical protein